MAPGDAIALFVGVESLLLALIAACLVLIAPGRGYSFVMPVTPTKLALWTLVCNGVMALGAFAAWGQIYVGGEWRGPVETVIAACLLVGIAFPATATYVLYRGFKDEE